MENNFVAIRKSDDETELSEIFLIVKDDGREWLGKPASISNGNYGITKSSGRLEVIKPYDDNMVTIFDNDEEAIAFIREDDKRVKLARRTEKEAPQLAQEAKPETVKPLPVNDNADDENQTVPDHVKLDMEIADREWLVKAVAEIRKAGGRIRAHDLRLALGTDDHKARRLVYALGELGYGEIGLYGTITLFKRYMGPEFEDAYRIAN